MKKLIALLSLAVALCASAVHAADARTVLSMTTKAGNTVSLVYVTTRGWMVTGSYVATITP